MDNSVVIITDLYNRRTGEHISSECKTEAGDVVWSQPATPSKNCQFLDYGMPFPWEPIEGLVGIAVDEIHKTAKVAAQADYLNPQKTLRDEFAMAALTGMWADSTLDGWTCAAFAEMSYKMADAMLKQRLVDEED